MSLLSLADVSVYRDRTPQGQSIKARATLATSPATTPAAGSPPATTPAAGLPAADAAPSGSTHAADAGSVSSYGRILTAQIPGEALLAYTTLLALFPDRDYWWGRLIVYLASLVVCAATVIGAYLARRIDSFDDDTSAGLLRQQHLPYFPAFTAVFAMATYGLTVPGSVLQQSMSAPSFAVVAGCLAVGGGVVMSIFALFLGKGNAAQVK